MSDVPVPCSSPEVSVTPPAIPPLGQLQRILQLCKSLSKDVSDAERETVTKAASRCSFIHEQARSDEGWRVASDSTKTSLRTLYRHEDKNVHSIKYSADFDCTVAQLVSIAREFDLVASWNKHVKASAVLSEPDLFKVVVYGSVFLPWPVTDRDIILDAQAYDLLNEHGCLVVPLRSTTDSENSDHAFEDKVEALPPTKRKNVRATMRDGSGLVLEPLPPLTEGGLPRTRATLICHMEPKMYMPGWLVKWFLGTVSPYIHRQIVQMLAERFKEGSVYHTRMTANVNLYGCINDRVATYMAKMPKCDVGMSADQWRQTRDKILYPSG